MLNRRATKINRQQPGGEKISRVIQNKQTGMEMAHAITTDLRKVNRADFHFDESGGADFFGGV